MDAHTDRAKGGDQQPNELPKPHETPSSHPLWRYRLLDFGRRTFGQAVACVPCRPHRRPPPVRTADFPLQGFGQFARLGCLLSWRLATLQLAWTLDDKVRWLKKILDSEGVTRPLLVGQSMGGLRCPGVHGSLPRHSTRLRLHRFPPSATQLLRNLGALVAQAHEDPVLGVPLKYACQFGFEGKRHLILWAEAHAHDDARLRQTRVLRVVRPWIQNARPSNRGGPRLRTRLPHPTHLRDERRSGFGQAI